MRCPVLEPIRRRTAAHRAKIWRVLCEGFFPKYIRLDDTVLDVGAGYREFINHVRCGRRLALDVSDDAGAYAGRDVEVPKARAPQIPLKDQRVEVVFASNFFDRLRDTDELLDVLRESRRVLNRGGRLAVLQPNIRYLPGAYWILWTTPCR
jgi:ubiquinone/menaquinone biosynthesis C-methylase UbiE